jgi:hypothetical protein
VNRPLVPEDLRRDPTAALVRACLAITRNVLDRKTSASDYARQAWGSDRAVETILRAATAPAMTTVPAWAGELSHTVQAFLSSLRGPTAGGDLLSRAVQLRFDGNKALTLPTISLTSVGFVAEGAPIPVRQFATAPGVRLDPHRLKVITVLSRELVEAGDAEAMVRSALAESAAVALDSALFSANAAVADLSPAGLLYGITATPASSVTVPTEAMMMDLSTLASAVVRVAGNDVAFVMAPEQSVAANLALERIAYPILTSVALAKGTVIAIALPALISAFGTTPQIEAAREPELVLDSSPADAGTTSQQTISVYQTDRIALKLRLPVGWILRSSNAVVFMNNVSR